MVSLIQPNFTLLLLFIVVALSASTQAQAQDGFIQTPDPECANNIRRGRRCCAKACGTCGGRGCGAKLPNRACCNKVFRGITRTCDKVGPPCKVPRVSTPNAPPKWMNLTTSGGIIKRHEACMVMVNGKAYLVGGRGLKRVNIFDPKTNDWTQGRVAPIQLHHMQCVAIGTEIWIVAAWTARFPFEELVPDLHIYNTVTNVWRKEDGKALPAARNRGGAASVVHNGKIYVAGGNQGGHGEHATTLRYFDCLDPKTLTWKTLPDLPQGEGRDHVGGAMVNGELCIAGGRDGGVKNFFDANKKTVYCFNFNSNSWIKKQDFPLPRAGAQTGTICDGRMMVTGGEGNGAFADVDLFDGTSWTKGPPMTQKRHGSGLAVSQCNGCGQVFVASGARTQGGRFETSTTEVYLPNGNPAKCAQY